MPAQEKVRVLIVDDIAETRDNLRRLLQFDSNIEVVGAARGGREAIEMSQQVSPDVIIMDINMPDMDGITATEQIRRRVPYAQVVILSVQSDPNYMRRAMLAGARDFLTKPPSIDELTGAIRRAGVMAAEERKKVQAYPTVTSENGQTITRPFQTGGKVIVVYSPKGGTGCTTLATNLSLALQSPETPTVLVDGSIQYGDIAVFLNEQVKNSVLDLTPRVDELDEDVIQSVSILHAASGLRVLAAPQKPEMAEKVIGEQFGKLLEYLRDSYTYIVVDTATVLTDVVQAALEKANLIVLVTTQEIPSIKNSSAFLSLADASGIQRSRILFVMNRFDRRLSISPDRVGESLRQPIAVTIPFDERLVVTSVNKGVPFIVENKSHPVSKSILQIAELARERLGKEDLDVEPIKK